MVSYDGSNLTFLGLVCQSDACKGPGDPFPFSPCWTWTKGCLPPTGASLGLASHLGAAVQHLPPPACAGGSCVCSSTPAVGQTLLGGPCDAGHLLYVPATTFPGHGLLGREVNRFPAAMGCEAGCGLHHLEREKIRESHHEQNVCPFLSQVAGPKPRIHRFSLCSLL